MKESQVFTHRKRQHLQEFVETTTAEIRWTFKLKFYIFFKPTDWIGIAPCEPHHTIFMIEIIGKKNPLKRTPLNYQKFILVMLLKHAIEYPTPLVYALSDWSTDHVFSAKKPLCLSFINGLAFNPTVPTSQHHLSKEICTQRQQRYLTLHEMAQHRCINPTLTHMNHV